MQNSMSSRKRKPERDHTDHHHHQQQQQKKKKKQWLGQDHAQNLGFSTRRKRSTKKKTENVAKATIYSWLIDSRTVEEGEEVFTVGEMRGILKREGILCVGCNSVLTAAAFHGHGCHGRWGRTSGKAYESIFMLCTGRSLLSCMMEAWKKPRESDLRKFNNVAGYRKGSIYKAGDLYDDACMVCADGGNLMCCEHCNSTYHQACMDMEDVPQGCWYCPFCVCKFCGNPAYPHDYLITCPQCEKKYHWECHGTEKRINFDLNTTPIAPFCDPSCKEIYDKLRKDVMGRRKAMGEGYYWRLIRNNGEYGEEEDDQYLTTLSHSKLGAARTLMEACFEPILDRHTRIKIIPSLLYNCGSNFKRVDFRGFYTAILEKYDEIITVASLRIHGKKLAEMPFIATSEAHRCKGMCKTMMTAIESALCYLKVESLIIPSVPEKAENWIQSHGFSRLTRSMRNQIKFHNTLTFHDSIRLQKDFTSSSHLKTEHNLRIHEGEGLILTTDHLMTG